MAILWIDQDRDLPGKLEFSRNDHDVMAFLFDAIARVRGSAPPVRMPLPARVWSVADGETTERTAYAHK
jgi:hypothetical protein